MLEVILCMAWIFFSIIIYLLFLLLFTDKAKDVKRTEWKRNRYQREEENGRYQEDKEQKSKRTWKCKRKRVGRAWEGGKETRQWGKHKQRGRKEGERSKEYPGRKRQGRGHCSLSFSSSAIHRRVHERWARVRAHEVRRFRQQNNKVNTAINHFMFLTRL